MYVCGIQTITQLPLLYYFAFFLIANISLNTWNYFDARKLNVLFKNFQGDAAAKKTDRLSAIKEYTFIVKKKEIMAHKK